MVHSVQLYLQYLICWHRKTELAASWTRVKKEVAQDKLPNRGRVRLKGSTPNLEAEEIL
jgi:hypothetical protein